MQRASRLSWLVLLEETSEDLTRLDGYPLIESDLAPL